MAPAPCVAITTGAHTVWASGSPTLSAKAHLNVVIVALANKLARTAWAVLQQDTRYDGRLLASA